MRLPWPFGRAQRSASADPGVSAGASAPVETPSGDAWRSLPPLAETVGPPPLVAPNRPFAASLSASEPPAPILAPLSHGRSLEAPRGLVSGIARPTSTVSGPALPAPVQRSPLGGHRTSAGDGADAFLPAEASAPAEPSPATAAPAPSGAAPEPPAAPMRRLETVTAAAPARTTLTRAPEPARPAPLVGLVGQPRAPGAGRAPLELPVPAVQRSPSTSAASTPPASTTSPVPAATPAPLGGAARLTIGQARRLGLGAPVAGGPVTSSTQAFKRGADPVAGPMEAARLPSLGSVDAGPGMQRAPEPDAPAMPLVSRPAPSTSEEAPVEAPGRVAEPHVPPPTPIATAAGQPASGHAAPIVSAQPLRTGVQRAPLILPQRAPAEPVASGAAAATPAPSGGTVKVHRDSRASQLSTALDARSFTHGGEIFLPASHGPLTSGTGKALLAHELTHVVQQRRLGSSLPPEHSANGKSLEAEAVAAERSPDMPLARASQGPTTAAATSTASTAVAGPSPTTTAHVPGPQRAPAEGGAGGSAGASSRSGATGRASSGSSGHSHSEQELEVLAHQLYHRIGRHLRRELLVDRERVGFALDLP